MPVENKAPEREIAKSGAGAESSPKFYEQIHVEQDCKHTPQFCWIVVIWRII